MGLHFLSAARSGWSVMSVSVVAAAFALSACAAKKNTEIIVAVQTDVQVPKDLDSVKITVLSFGASQFEQDYPVGPGGVRLPSTIGIVAGKDPSQPVDVIIVGSFKTKKRVLREARLKFAEGRTVLMRMPLRFACFDRADCPTDQTCVAGACQGIDVDVDKLPDYSDPQVFGDPSASSSDGAVTGAGASAGCFDPVGCLSATTGLASTDDPCVFDATAVADKPLSVVLRALDVGTAGQLGFCTDSGCRVPVDFDVDEGWSFTDAAQKKVRLAKGICDAIVAKKWAVEATTACGTKTISVPLCDLGAAGGDAGPGVDVGVDTALDAPSDDVLAEDVSPDDGAADATPDATLDATIDTTPDATPDSTVDDIGGDSTFGDSGVDSTLGDTDVDSTATDGTVFDSTLADTTVDPSDSGVDSSLADAGGDVGVDSTPVDSGPLPPLALPSRALLVTSEEHACRLATDGTVQCWGGNSIGGLPFASTASTSTPARVPSLSNVAALGLAQYFGCALATDRTVKCWGDNSWGQLGDGAPGTPHSTPAAVIGLPSNVASLSLSRWHACVSTTDGLVYCWGNNDYGQLGDGSTTARSSPTLVPGLTGVARITAGSNSTCAVLSDGSAQCWGRNYSGELGDGSNTNHPSPNVVPGLTGVDSIAMGSMHVCARSKDGSVRCWGDNSFGQLGDGTTVQRLSPTIVPGLTGVSELSLGGNHSLALTTDGVVHAWGSNSSGQQCKTGGDALSPAAVAGLSSIASVSAGGDLTCARGSDGNYRCCGVDLNGELGDGRVLERHSPGKVPGLAGATSIATGARFACSILSDATVSCWGENDKGQLARSLTSVGDSTPKPAVGLSSITQLALGHSHGCALTSAGAVLCWGDNGQGQLGNGTTTSTATPTAVPSLTSGVSQIAAGGLTTCALLATGEARCWGYNNEGEIGDGSTIARYVPTAVSGVSTATKISVGDGSGHACAVLADKTVRCWGSNNVGQLGDGTTGGQSSYPLTVVTLTGATDVALGYDHSCARKTDGTVSCWGSSYGGAPSATPLATSIAGLTSVSSLTAGERETCVLHVDGSVACWGSNYEGDLGDGTTTDSSTPVAVPGLSGVGALAAGQFFACARLTDGTARCWGSNYDGQLGDGAPVFRATPVVLTPAP